MTGSYDVSGVLPGETLTSVPAGTNLAIVGPSMTGKADLVIQLLTAGYEDGDGILCITTKRSISRLLDTVERQAPSLDRESIGVIDCMSSGDEGTDRPMTERVSSPADLTGISIGMTKLKKRFQERGISQVRYGLLSVSTLLQYLDVNRVFKFLHIYTRRVTDTSGFGVYTLDDDAHSPQAVNTITGQFDGLVTLRETDDGAIEFRVRGLERRPTRWMALE